MGATATAFLLDNSVRNNLTGNPTNNDSFLMRVGHSYGDFYYNLYFATGLHLTSYILKSKSLALTGKSLIESLILGGLASISIKFIFGRSRPYKEEGNFKFNFFETENKNNSLPSGHVITAFTTSTILSKSIDNFYISLVLYALSGLTFYQRLATDNHWFSDAFIGAALGYFIGEYTYNRNYENMSKGEGPSIIPFLYKDNFGVNFNYFF
ncbi:MAG: phosphatase PAP2 family protein [Melioribacteraceae bacterium]|nr:phosphatase PAP2 family protein [Melioribacteraceae bacterium]